MPDLISIYKKLSPLTRAILQSLISLFVFYGGALLEQKVQNDFESQSIGVFTIRAIVVIVLLAVFIAGGLAIRSKIDSAEQEDLARRKQKAYAWSLMDQYVGNQIAKARVSATATDDARRDHLLEQIGGTTERMNEIVRDVYNFFESQHGRSDEVNEMIDFEVTFMTRSYKDKYITIPVHANRQRRAPPSLALRPSNLAIYDNTLAAKIYAETRPTLKLVEDTPVDSDYVDLYPGQKTRIRSMLVYPVLSDENRVLGVLVVHCNKVGFFTPEDSRFWEELMEIFSKRLALEKARMDWVMSDEFAKTMKFSVLPPF